MENALPWFRLPSSADWRDVALPKEHGSWSLALEPLAFGLIAAPSVGGAWLALAVAGAFFARRPLRIAWRDASAERRLVARGVLLLCGAVTLFSALAAVATDGVAWLVWLIPAAIAGALFLSFDLRNAGREAPAEVAGTLAFALITGALGALACGETGETIALVIMMGGRSVPTVLTVRAALRGAKTGKSEVAPALISAVAAIAAGSVCALNGWSGWVGPMALAVLAVRSFGLLVFPRPVLRARTIGMIEAVLGLVYVVVVAATWYR